MSVTSQCSIETSGRIELVFGRETSFDLSYTMSWRNSGIYKNKGISLRNFVLNSGLRKLNHGTSIIKACYQLSWTKADTHRVIKWTVVGQLIWQFPCWSIYTLTLNNYSITVIAHLCLQHDAIMRFICDSWYLLSLRYYAAEITKNYNSSDLKKIFLGEFSQLTFQW